MLDAVLRTAQGVERVLWWRLLMCRKTTCMAPSSVQVQLVAGNPYYQRLLGSAGLVELGPAVPSQDPK
jgi:hypothetical protein